MPPPHGQAAELVLRLGAENDVVHDDKHVPGFPLLEQFLLLFVEQVHQRLVPVVEKEPRVPLWVPFHHRFEYGAARCTPHKSYNQVEMIKQPVH